MKAGDTIKLQVEYSDWTRFKVEEFRHCLGVFLSEDARVAGRFYPLCKMYVAGADSEVKYISNYGEYTTNLVPSWIECANRN